MALIEGNTLTFPKQRLSFKEKTDNNCEWGKKMVDLLILNYATDQSYVPIADSEYQRKLSNYQLYNNKLNQSDFQRDCNALGLSVGQFQDEIKPYNKAPNKINVLLGEELKRTFNFRTVLVNSEGVKSKQEAKSKLLRQYIQSYIESLIAKHNPSVSPEVPLENTVKPEEINEYMAYTYLDAKEKLANQLLQYLFYKEDIIDKKNDGFKHGLLSGEEHGWVGVENGEPVIQVLNSLGVFYHKSPETKYIQDGLYAGYRTRMTSGDIIDRFSDDLTSEDLSKIEVTLQSLSGMDAQLSKKMKYYTDDISDAYLRQSLLENSNSEGSYSLPKAEDWVVTHVEWRSEKKVGFIKSINEYGEEEETMVSEDFEVPSYATVKTEVNKYGKRKTTYYFDGMTLEWGWIPEIWEGVRIGADIYCCIRPKTYQYRSVDNPHKVKLGYHGVCYSAMNADPISLMDRMKPFQYLYFIIAHKLRKLIARDRGQVFHFDLSMVPETMGLEKTLYYLEEMDIDFYNPLQNAETPGAYQRGKISGATPRSNMQFILNYVQLLAAIDEQISDVAGITRQREGMTTPNQAVTNAQQDIMQSSTLTEAIYFKPHEKHWENMLNSLLQCAQSVWAHKSVIKQYVLDDSSIQTLNIPAESLYNADFGVFVSNSSKDNQLFDALKGLAQPLLQNDKAKFSDILKMLKATSVRELELDIAQSEKRLQEEQLQQIRAQQEAQKEAQQLAAQTTELQFQHAKELQAQKDAAALERELVKASGFGADVNENQVPDALEYQKFREEITLEYDKLKHEKEDNQKERDTKLEIAKIAAKSKSIAQRKK